MVFKKRKDETDKQFYERCLLNKKLIGTWADVAHLIERTLGKKETAQNVRVYYFRYLKNRDEDPLRDLRMQKQAFRDERNAWEKQNRQAARATVDLDYLAEVVEQIARQQFPTQPVAKTRGRRKQKKTLLIVLSDWHIGARFKSIFGQYDTETAKARLGIYIQRIKEIAEMYQIDEINIMAVGDMISGSIHRSVQVQNRENIIEQIKTASEMMASFIDEMCGTFKKVTFTGCSGNHSRIDKKEDALKDERLDDLILWIVKGLLQNKRNFYYLQPEDTSICTMTINGKTWHGVHGDYDRNTNAGIQKLISALDQKPYGVVMGHLHTPTTAETNGVKVIQAGSLAGSGDDFTVQKRLTGKASQTAVLIDETGKLEAIFPMELV